MSAFALPGENRTNEIWVKMNDITSKSIHNIIDCDLKKNWQILIFVDANSFDATCQDRSSFHLTKCLFLHYLGKPKQAK